MQNPASCPVRHTDTFQCTQVIQIAQEQNLEIRREGDKWFGPDGEELDVEEEIELEKVQSWVLEQVT